MKKSILLPIFCVIAVLFICSGTAAAYSATYHVPSDVPWTGTTGLNVHMAQHLDAEYIIDEDSPNLGTWTPVGSLSTPFIGRIAANNGQKTITGINVDRGNNSYSGMFGVVSTGFQAENLKFVDCTITSTKDYLGVLYGRGTGTGISVSNVDAYNCTVKSTATSGGNTVGGIAGFGAHTSSTATFTNCDVERCYIATSGGNNVGGIAGYGAATSSTVTFATCTTKDCVIETSGGNYVGGIAGHGADTSSTANFETCTVRNCTVSAGSTYAGGICGRVYSGCIGTFNSCTVSGTSVLATTKYAAGICPKIGE